MNFVWSKEILETLVGMWNAYRDVVWTKGVSCCVGHPKDECPGPCFDFCPCEHCWNGWSELSFVERLRGHVAYLWDIAKQRQAWRDGHDGSWELKTGRWS